MVRTYPRQEKIEMKTKSTFWKVFAFLILDNTTINPYFLNS